MSWAHHSPVWATALNGRTESGKWHGHGAWRADRVAINQSINNSHRRHGGGEKGVRGSRAKGDRGWPRGQGTWGRCSWLGRGPRKPRRGQEQGQESRRDPQDSGQERPKVEAKRGDQEKAKRGGTKNQKQPRKRAKPRRGGLRQARAKGGHKRGQERAHFCQGAIRQRRLSPSTLRHACEWSRDSGSRKRVCHGLVIHCLLRTAVTIPGAGKKHAT